MTDQVNTIPSENTVQTPAQPRRRTRPPVATLITQELMVGVTPAQGAALQTAADFFEPPAYRALTGCQTSAKIWASDLAISSAISYW